MVNGSGVVDRGRCVVSGSRMRSRGMVCWGSMRSGMGSWVSLVMGLARVGHISNIARVRISNVVSHGLETTVGKLDMVGAAGGISVTVLALAKVGAGVVVVDAILVVVVSGLLLVGRLGVVRWSRVGVGMGTVVGDGRGKSHGGEDGKSDESLHFVF
jgi:hypothetical protein